MASAFEHPAAHAPASDAVVTSEIGHDLAEQFDDFEQQRQSDHLGMWIFLCTEVILFGGLFTGYTVYRTTYPEAWRAASQHMHIAIGAINTAVLLTSSFFMALAVHWAQVGRRRPLVLNLLITMGLGLIFLVLKGYEYKLEIDDNLLPWRASFHLEGPYARQETLFLIFYWVMTGLHATHMLIGLSVLGLIAWMSARGRFSIHYHSPVEVAGLYWHFVDIVWIFILPTLYLIHPSG